MKKIILSIVLSIAAVCAVTAQETETFYVPAGIQVGAYADYDASIGKIYGNRTGTVIGGLEAYWTLPIPEAPANIGISGHFDIGKPLQSYGYINNWITYDPGIGIWADLPVTDAFAIRPEFIAGLNINNVRRVINGDSGVYFRARAALTAIITPAFLDAANLSIEAGVNFTMLDTDKVGRAFGGKLGIIYTFKKKVTVVHEPEPVVEVVEEEEEELEISEDIDIQFNADGSVDIKIPNLSFESNSAKLTSAKSNKDTIQEVYNILRNPKYAKFSVSIIGFVNPDSLEWTLNEKRLANRRAETVKSTLVEMGIDAGRITTGYGSGKTNNKEYNRRVEFKLR